MGTRIYTHEACLAHRPGPGHPESPARLEAVLAALSAPEFGALDWAEAPMGRHEQLLLVHTPQYVDEVESLAPEDGVELLDGGDTLMSPGTWEAVMRCVGGACAGVDDVVRGVARNAYSCATTCMDTP